MSFYYCRNSKIYSSTGTARVSGVDSELITHPFTNAYTEWQKPWREWRSSYSNSHEHDLHLNYTSSSWGFVMLGCNFATIEYDSGILNLVQDKDTGDYSLWYVANDYQNLYITIPAQHTDEGYFRIKSIGVVSSIPVSLGDFFYPMDIKYLQPSFVSENVGGKMIKAKAGRPRHILEMRSKGLSTNIMQSFNTIVRVGHGLNLPFYFIPQQLAPFTEPTETSYLVRRLEDFVYTERSYKNFMHTVKLEEIA